jgi:hypothetical protein
MCETLLYDYKLSVPSIERIRTAAKVYGNPGDIIRAITEIGGLQAIEMAVKSDEDKRDRLLAEVGELKKQKAQLEGQIDAFKTIAMPKMLNEIPAALKRQFESSLEPSVQAFSQYVNTLSNQVQRYHQLLGQTQALEQQLDIVRVFLAVCNMPDHKTQYAAYYAYDFIIAAGNYVTAMV